MEKNKTHINKRVRATTDVISSHNNDGVLIKINETGNYPFIIKFDSGSTFGVNNYILIE